MRRLIGVSAVVVMALLVAPVMVSAQSIGRAVTFIDLFHFRVHFNTVLPPP